MPYLRSRDGKNLLEIATVKLPDAFILQVGKNAGDREEVLASYRRVALGIAIPIILLGLVGGQFLAGRALRPIRHLIQMVRTITATGKMEARAPVGPAGDELDELARLFNQMLDRIAGLMNGMRETLDNVAHDLRTPLTRMRGVAETALQAQDQPGACQEALADCLEEAERISILVTTLMDIAEAETGTMRLKLEEVNLAPLLAEVKVPEPEPADLASLAKIPADQAMTAALAAYPGSRVRALALENEDGCLVYSVLLSNGLEVKVDAGNGQVLRAASEDDDDNLETEVQAKKRRTH